MIRALYSAASGMNAQQTNLDNIANNLANASTTGYKSRRAQFQDLMYQNMVQPGAAAGQETVVPSGLQVGLGTRAASNSILFTQGSFTETDNPLDLVVQGSGFFQVQLPNGELAYTRAGSFQLNNTGSIVDSNGNLLQPNIVIPSNAQSITDRHRRHGQLYRARLDIRAEGGANPACEFRQSSRTEQPRRQRLSAHRRVGRADHRQSWGQ